MTSTSQLGQLLTSWDEDEAKSQGAILSSKLDAIKASVDGFSLKIDKMQADHEEMLSTFFGNMERRLENVEKALAKVSSVISQRKESEKMDTLSLASQDVHSGVIKALPQGGPPPMGPDGTPQTVSVNMGSLPQSTEYNKLTQQAAEAWKQVSEEAGPGKRVRITVGKHLSKQTLAKNCRPKDDATARQVRPFVKRAKQIAKLQSDGNFANVETPLHWSINLINHHPDIIDLIETMERSCGYPAAMFKWYLVDFLQNQIETAKKSAKRNTRGEVVDSEPTPNPNPTATPVPNEISIVTPLPKPLTVHTGPIASGSEPSHPPPAQPVVPQSVGMESDSVKRSAGDVNGPTGVKRAKLANWQSEFVLTSSDCQTLDEMDYGKIQQVCLSSEHAQRSMSSMASGGRQFDRDTALLLFRSMMAPQFGTPRKNLPHTQTFVGNFGEFLVRYNIETTTFSFLSQRVKEAILHIVALLLVDQKDDEVYTLFIHLSQLDMAMPQHTTTRSVAGRDEDFANYFDYLLNSPWKDITFTLLIFVGNDIVSRINKKDGTDIKPITNDVGLQLQNQLLNFYGVKKDGRLGDQTPLLLVLIMTCRLSPPFPQEPDFVKWFQTVSDTLLGFMLRDRGTRYQEATRIHSIYPSLTPPPNRKAVERIFRQTLARSRDIME